ncbi:hypothetical protein D3C87_1563320 [compost metagenome]
MLRAWARVLTTATVRVRVAARPSRRATQPGTSRASSSMPAEAAVTAMNHEVGTFSRRGVHSSASPASATTPQAASTRWVSWLSERSRHWP